jgi:protein-S-isoprenylcysteine O-methyltransferase Ste14
VPPLGWLAALVLFLQLPIPLFWFVLHPQVKFWRRHQTAGYISGVLLSWGPVTASMILFHARLFRSDQPPAWSVTTGLALLVLEAWIFWRVKRDLGAAKLVGKAELSGGGEVVHQGIYARIRHPRYVGSLLAILGACFLAGTRWMWAVAAVWWLLTLVAIAMEERELRARFGLAYDEYCRRVPRFLPLGSKPHASGSSN